MSGLSLCSIKIQIVQEKKEETDIDDIKLKLSKEISVTKKTAQKQAQMEEEGDYAGTVS